MQLVVGGGILSAPVGMHEITLGEVWISGNLPKADARSLAAKLRR